MRRTLLLICLAIAGFGATGTAYAGVPTATTGGAGDVTASTATLNGTVDPNKEDTTYWFEYGKTTAYGRQTAHSGPVHGNAPKSVSASISGLAPSTTYHFRLVATNPSGTDLGADATFTTTAAAVTIAAKPPVVKFGGSVTISGQVPGEVGVKVELEATPFPYTEPFKKVAEDTTDTSASYSFVVTPALNTRYRVQAKSSPPATSPELTVRVRPRVTLRVSDRTPARGARVRFKGSVLPAHDGSEVRIQRKTRHGWKTIATSLLKPATPLDGVARSKYRKRVRIYRSGYYRTVLPSHGDHARGKSRKRHITVH